MAHHPNQGMIFPEFPELPGLAPNPTIRREFIPPHPSHNVQGIAPEFNPQSNSERVTLRSKKHQPLPMKPSIDQTPAGPSAMVLPREVDIKKVTGKLPEIIDLKGDNFDGST